MNKTFYVGLDNGMRIELNLHTCSGINSSSSLELRGGKYKSVITPSVSIRNGQGEQIKNTSDAMIESIQETLTIAVNREIITTSQARNLYEQAVNDLDYGYLFRTFTLWWGEEKGSISKEFDRDMFADPIPVDIQINVTELVRV